MASILTYSRSILALTCAAGPLASSQQDAYWQAGVGYFAAEDFRKAQEAFEQAVQAAPENSTYALWLGLSMGRRAEGMTGLRKLGALPLVKRMKHEFERAIVLDESNLDAHEALLEFHLRAPRIAGGSKTEAEAIATQIKEIDPARGAAARAACDENSGDFVSAGEQFALAWQLAPDEMRHLVGYAAFLSRRGEFAKSDELFDIAFSRDPDNPKLWRAAATAWVRAKRQSRYPRARELIERYLSTPDREPNPDPRSELRKLLKGL